MERPAVDMEAMERWWGLLKARVAMVDEQAPERLERALSEGHVSFAYGDDGLVLKLKGCPMALVSWRMVANAAAQQPVMN